MNTFSSLLFLPVLAAAIALHGADPTGPGRALYGHDICIEGNPDYDALRAEITRLKANGGNYADLRMRWSDLETAPFQYDFTKLDLLVEQCRKEQLPYLLTVFHGGTARHPAFLNTDLMRDQDGRESGSEEMKLPAPNRYGSTQGTLATYSLHSERVMKHYDALYKALIARYGKDPLLAGYSVPFGSVDVLYQDSPGNRWIFDYSEPARLAFAAFLQEEKKFDLATANRRYGTAWSEWAQVTLPKPVFDGPDRRPHWRDFQEFKAWSYRRNLEHRLKLIRDNDPNPDRRIYVWAQFNGPLEPALPLFRQYDAMPNFSGFEGTHNHYLAGAAERAGVKFIVEPSEIPPSPRSWARSLFHAMCYGGKGIMWVFHFRDDSPALPVFRSYRAAFEELSDSVRLPATVAGLFPSTSRFHEQPGFILWDWRHFYVVNEMMAQTLHADLPIDWFGSAAPELDKLGNYRLLLDSGAPIMAEKTIGQLTEFVRNGGTLLLQGDSARNALENDTPYPLLARLGFPVEKIQEPYAKFVPAKPSPDGPFAGLKLLPLQNARKLTGLPSMFRPVVTAPDGAPLAVEWNFGKGRVLLLGGNLYWGWRDAGTIRGFLDALAKWTGISKPLSIESPGTVEAMLKMHGSTRYVLLFNADKQYREALNVKVRLPDLPPGDYRVEGMIGPFPACRRTAAELALGVTLNLTPAELQVLKIVPEQSAARLDYLCNRFAAVPKIDGTIKPDEWKNTSPRTGGTVHATARPAAQPWECRFGYDSDALYFAVNCREPDAPQIRAVQTAPGSPVWTEDSVELFFDVTRSRENAAQLGLNARNTLFTNAMMTDRIETAAAIGPDRWEVEGKIRFADLGVPPPRPGDRWGFNVRRNRFAGGAGESSNLFDVPDYPPCPEKFGDLIFN